MTIVTRAAKGSKLTHPELDNNFTELNNAILAMQTLVQSNDINLDTVQELVNYIKSNKSLIDQITTNKIDTSAIINTLSESTSGKTLDARQGKTLKDLIDALTTTVSNNTSALANKVDKNGTDRLITAAEGTKLSNTSGVNSGDETEASIINKIGTAGVIKTQYLPPSSSGATIDDVTAATDKVYSSSKTNYFLNKKKDVGLAINKAFNFVSFGDSFTDGTGATELSSGYVNIIKAKTGLLVDNYGYGGTGAFYAAKKANDTLPFVQQSNVITWMCGFNDYQKAVTANVKTQKKVTGCLTSILASAFIKSGIPASDAGLVKTGTWSNISVGIYGGKAGKNSGQGISTTTANNFVTYAFTGNNVVVGTFASDNSSGFELGAIDIYIDNVLVRTYDPANRTDGITDNSPTTVNNNKRTPECIFVTGLTNAAHTLKVVAKTSTTTIIDFVGILNDPKDCFPVFAGAIPRTNAAYNVLYPATSQAIIDTGYQVVKDAVDLLPDYPVTIVDVNQYYNLFTGVNADNIHPNNIGHYQIASAFLDSMKAPAPNSVLPTVTSGEKVITVTSAGPQKTYDVASYTASAATLAALSWTTDTVTSTGIEGQKAYDTDYEYTCVGTNTWRRSAINGKKVDLYLGTVDDSAGLKTSVQLDALYPSAIIVQRVRGASGYYEKYATVWVYYAGTVV